MIRRIVNFPRTPSSAPAERRSDRSRAGPLPVIAWLVGAICGLSVFPAEAPAGTGISESRLFDGLVEIQVDGFLELPSWDDVHRRLADQQTLVRDCRGGGTCRSEGAGVLADVLDRLATQDRRTQVNEINRLFNRRPYVSDVEQFNLPDKWQSPLDLLEGGGDCEDFAIAKYFALRQLGVPDDDLRIVVAQEPTSGSGHAFLAVALEGREMILDYDVSRPVRQTLTPVRPRYAFNASKRWLFVPRRGSR